MKIYIMPIIMSTLLIGCAIKKDIMTQTEIGNSLPSITLVDQDGVSRTLSDFKGHRLVIYFYPKNDTPGCTKQACSLRDVYGLFAAHNIEVIGINYESPQAHKAFQEKYHLPFIFLSDPDQVAAKALGAYTGLMRRWFPARMTLLVDEAGRILHIIKDVDVTTHTADILNYFGIEASK